MVVDDDDAGGNLIARLLRRNGYEVKLEKSPIDALMSLDQSDFDLVITDLVMPEMNGFDLCVRIRENQRIKTIPIILVSVRGEVGAVVEGLDTGADDYIVKPFNHDEFLARVRTHLRLRDLQDRLVRAEQSRVLGELAGAAAHEIYQPLTILLGYAEMMIPMVEDDDLLAKIEEIVRRGEEIADIVRRIQDLKTYKTKSYLNDRNIIDLSGSSNQPE